MEFIHTIQAIGGSAFIVAGFAAIGLVGEIVPGVLLICIGAWIF